MTLNLQNTSRNTGIDIFNSHFRAQDQPTTLRIYDHYASICSNARLTFVWKDFTACQQKRIICTADTKPFASRKNH